MHQRYVVGFRIADRYRHVQLDAEDALDAAQRVKAAHPDAHITYARRHNQRADRRHPEPMLGEERPIPAKRRPEARGRKRAPGPSGR